MRDNDTMASSERTEIAWVLADPPIALRVLFGGIKVLVPIDAANDRGRFVDLSSRPERIFFYVLVVGRNEPGETRIAYLQKIISGIHTMKLNKKASWKRGSVCKSFKDVSVLNNL